MSDQSHYRSDDYVRQKTNQGALLNANNDALKQYKETKKRYAKLNTIDELTDRVSRIESTLDKILALLENR